MYDCVVVGNGPAGLSAMLYLIRAGIKSVLIGKGESALKKADKVENYFGSGTLSGQELLSKGVKQVLDLGGNIIESEVVGISYDGSFTITTQDQVYGAKSVILATGSTRKKANIKGLAEFEGSGVSYCAICDAFFYRGADVAVIGNGEFARHEAEELLPVVGSVTILTNGEKTESVYPESVKVINEKIECILGDGVVSGVRFANGEELPVKGVFVALGTASGVDFARTLGLETQNGKLIVNEDMETMIRGLYAAGDCTQGVMQVAVAVAEGAKAALSAIKFIRESKQKENA